MLKKLTMSQRLLGLGIIALSVATTPLPAFSQTNANSRRPPLRRNGHDT